MPDIIHADAPASRTAPRFGWLRVLALAGVTFLMVYNISPVGRESLTSTRVCIALLLLVATGLNWFRRPLPDAQVLLIFLPLPFAFLQSSMSLDSEQISRFANLLVNSVLGGWLLAQVARKREELLAAYLVAVLCQSAFILASFFSLELRDFVSQHIATGANFDAVDIYRAPGFASDAGSSLSVTQSLGVLAGGLLLHRLRGSGRLVVAPIVFAIFVIAASCIFVGRTGLIISWTLILIFAYMRLIPRSAIVVGLLTIAAAGALALKFIGDLLPDSFSSDYFLDWAFGFLSGKNSSVSDLASMPIPPLSVRTLLGTGLVGLSNGANPSGNDSGFVQNYFSLGLVLAILLYVAYANALYRLVRWMPALVGAACIIIFFAAEVKEPFLFKHSIMTFLIATSCARDGWPRRQAARPAP